MAPPRRRGERAGADEVLQPPEEHLLVRGAAGDDAAVGAPGEHFHRVRVPEEEVRSLARLHREDADRAVARPSREVSAVRTERENVRTALRITEFAHPPTGGRVP